LKNEKDPKGSSRSCLPLSGRGDARFLGTTCGAGKPTCRFAQTVTLSIVGHAGNRAQAGPDALRQTLRKERQPLLRAR
jgi:hypothetical protein